MWHKLKMLSYQHFGTLKNQLNDVHQEISDRTQKQLKAFAKQNPEIKQPDSEPDQSAPILVFGT